MFHFAFSLWLRIFLVKIRGHLETQELYCKLEVRGKFPTNDFDEVQFITGNADFISEALEIENVEVYQAGNGEDVAGKARSSLPLEPGIAWR